MMEAPVQTFPYLFMFFILFLIACLGFSRLRLRHLDASTRYRLPDLTALTPLEVALLRDGFRGFIHIILFELWLNKNIKLSRGDTKTEITTINLFADPPEHKLERLVFKFIAHRAPVKFSEFFEKNYLRILLDKEIKSLNRKLEFLHLKKNQQQQKQAKTIFWGTLFFIGLVGGILSLYYYYFIFFLIIAILITKDVLALQDITYLGEEYLQQLAQHYEFLKEHSFTEVEPSWIIAVFGVTGLANLSLYSSFHYALMPPDDSRGGNGGFHGGGGGGCGGGGGGCGGGGGGGGGGG